MYMLTGCTTMTLTISKDGTVLPGILDFLLMPILKYGVVSVRIIFLEMYSRLGKQKLTLSALGIHVVPVQMT